MNEIRGVSEKAMNWTSLLGFNNEPYNLVLHYTRLEMFASNKYLSLLGPQVRKNDKLWIQPWCLLHKHFYACSLQL